MVLSADKTTFRTYFLSAYKQNVCRKCPNSQIFAFVQVLCIIATRPLYCPYKAFVVSVQGPCSVRTKPLYNLTAFSLVLICSIEIFCGKKGGGSVAVYEEVGRRRSGEKF